MLFNSYQFIFLFLPITLLLFFSISKKSNEFAIIWLVLASLFFYGWWNPVYLFLIIASMLVNYSLGKILSGAGEHATYKKRWTLIIGITLNLSALGYYKYADFFIENINSITSYDFNLEEIILPLAISFFTFQQIAYLVDAYKGITKEYRFSHYALFVTFFPQLIAGPIVHHKEMLPQFLQGSSLRRNIENITVGVTIFSIGLFKKAVLADGIAQYATPVFNTAGSGEAVSFFVAWGGALAYTFQLYFDFSGYSDMAIGGARLFGVKLPLNFHSPYKATSIVEFWRRWHMTLSRFLRDYLYIPLGGSKCGATRRYANLIITMLLGGLWHGAGWTFVIWGGLHGFYLIINHAWHKVQKLIGFDGILSSNMGKAVAWLITFIAVVISWVFFRANDLDSALVILKGMSGANGVELPNAILSRLGDWGTVLQTLGINPYFGGGTQFVLTYVWVIALMVVAILFPNTQQVISNYAPALVLYNHGETSDHSLKNKIVFNWKPNLAWASIIAIMAVLGILALTSVSEFLYFQF